MLAKMDFLGNPYVGVYCASNNQVVFVSSFISKSARKQIEEALEVQSRALSLGGSTVLGSLMCMNTNGSIVTNFADVAEISHMEDMRVEPISQRRLNAVGNTILCNDNGAVVHPNYNKSAIKFIEDVLGVEVSRGTIAGLKTVGSASVTNNRGVLCHPHIKDGEKELLEDVLKVPVTISTANYGTPQIGACIVANDKGALVGSATTPIELGRIEEGLRYY
ncbi:MAG: translation initiation factor IF-6 [Methanomassiliicoccales archaeon]|nr:MAG: translation initiation factor IF-6 [Methanomassiliicoccales archaeon]